VDSKREDLMQVGHICVGKRFWKILAVVVVLSPYIISASPFDNRKRFDFVYYINECGHFDVIGLMFS
jgi:hypothetical protein